MSFDTDLKDLIEQIPVALKVFASGVEAFVNDKSQVIYISNVETSFLFDTLIAKQL